MFILCFFCETVNWESTMEELECIAISVFGVSLEMKFFSFVGVFFNCLKTA